MVVHLKTWRLAGLTKDVFEELIQIAGIPVQYFCRRSFITWDILLPTKEVARLGESCIKNNNVLLAAAWIYGVTLSLGDCMQCPCQPQRKCSGLFPVQLRKSRGSDTISHCCRDSTWRLCVSHITKLGRLPNHPGYHLQPEQTNDGSNWGQAATLLEL